MINTKQLLKVASAWVSAVYVICYVGVLLFPGVREGFMRYALHTTIDAGGNVVTFATFVSGLVIWNIVALAAFGLFAFFFNRVKA